VAGLRAGLGRAASRARSARPGGGSTARRWLVAIPWLAFALFVVLAGGTIFALALIGLGLVALHELYRMLEPVRPLRLAGFAGLAGLVVAAQWGDKSDLVLVATGAVLLAFLMALARDSIRHVTLAIGATLLGVFWIGLAMAHASLLRGLDHGDGLLIDVLVATFAADAGAYFGGRLYGMHKLAPTISPGKTVEGLIAGVISGTVAFWLAGLYQDWLSGIDALVLGACVALTAPLGDLFESMVKRDLQVKDSGRFFGPHGGALDRLDASFVTVIVGYYAATAIL
jgi:phosphatidate cytidylyltransferase